MEIQAITPNYYSNPYNKTAYNKRANVTFQAKYVEAIEKMMEGSTKESFAEKLKTKLAGTFGFSKDKVMDFVKQVYDEFSQLIKDNKDLKGANAKLNRQIYEFQNALPEQLRNERNTAIQNTSETFRTQMQQLKDAAQEATKAKDAAEKAQQVAEEAAKEAENRAIAAEKRANEAEKFYRVGDIDDLGVITPEKGIQLIDEIIANHPKAKESLSNFMFHGKGEEELFEQIKRFRILDDITNSSSENYLLWNSSFERAMNRLYPNKDSISIQHPIDGFGNLLEYTLTDMNNQQIQLLNIPKVRKQAIENLTRIIVPNNLYKFSPESLSQPDRVAEQLEKDITDALNKRR